MKVRIERDPLGEVRVPADAYYGAQTQRAVENFPISGLTAPPELVIATVQIKKAAAEANAALGRLAPDIADAIVRAADEVLAGKLRDQFVVDVYQAGAGTSHNMNTNEVLANRAGEIARRDARRRTRASIRTITSTWGSPPTTCSRRRRGSRCSRWCCAACGRRPATSPTGWRDKSGEFADVLKTGRTHLQDAVPITLGQEFSGYAANVAHATADLERDRRNSCSS